MKHLLFKLALFLLLGAIVNVAVAWGCAIPQHNPGYEGVVNSINEHLWAIRIQQHFGSVRRSYMSPQLFWDPLLEDGEDDDWQQLIEPTPRSSLYRMMDIGEFQGDEFEQLNGWPLYSLAGHGKIRYIPPTNPNQLLPANNGSLIFVGSRQPPGSNHYRRGGILPFRPIWPGFAINTVFYAAVLWLLTLAPCTARRMIRSKRGFCIKCGYDLRGMDHNKCPECGWGREEATA